MTAPPRPSLITFEERSSDSPFVERVWRSHSDRSGTFSSIAACHWDIVVVRLGARPSVIVRGPETKATTANCPAHGEWMGIRFKLGTFMPMLPPSSVRDRADVTLPHATGRSFWFNGSEWEYPTFDNAETFVARLVRAGAIVHDPMIRDAINGDTRAVPPRTEQRRFLRSTGLPRGAILQIERARRATRLLRQGRSILDATHQAGYYDQAHLTRSLKRWIGQTPARVGRPDQQLSFLYNP